MCEQRGGTSGGAVEATRMCEQRGRASGALAERPVQNALLGLLETTVDGTRYVVRESRNTRCSTTPVACLESVVKGSVFGATRLAIAHSAGPVALTSAFSWRSSPLIFRLPFTAGRC